MIPALHDLISHWVTLSWHWASQSLFYPNNAENQAWKGELSFRKSLVWLDQAAKSQGPDSKPRGSDCLIPQNRRLTLYSFGHPGLCNNAPFPYTTSSWGHCAISSIRKVTPVAGKPRTFPIVWGAWFMALIVFVRWCFASQQHLKPYQDEHWLVTARSRGESIMLLHWETRPTAHRHCTPHCHIIRIIFSVLLSRLILLSKFVFISALKPCSSSCQPGLVLSCHRLTK